MSNPDKQLFFGFALLVPIALFMGNIAYLNISFTNGCAGRLKRAADANTIEIAREELAAVITFAESNKMTEGYTSIIYRTPNEDVGFWYRNLKAAMGELEKVRPDTSQFERSNILIKLRETIIDHSKDGSVVTYPPGLSKYPYNTLMAILGVLFSIMAFFGFVLIKIAMD